MKKSTAWVILAGAAIATAVETGYAEKAKNAVVDGAKRVTKKFKKADTEVEVEDDELVEVDAD